MHRGQQRPLWHLQVHRPSVLPAQGCFSSLLLISFESNKNSTHRQQSSDSTIHKPPPKLSQFLLKSFEDGNRIYVKGACKGMGRVEAAKNQMAIGDSNRRAPVSVQNRNVHLLTLVPGQSEEEFCRYIYKDFLVEVLSMRMWCWCFRNACSKIFFL